MPGTWKRGRGKLGFLMPLLGAWVARGDSQLGPYVCERRYQRILNGAFLQLTADWRLGPRTYQEMALFGADGDTVRCWSFTSDAARSVGWHSADLTGLPEGAIVFEADMPAGRARQAYWPADEGFTWVVESRQRSGWRRFTEHHYRPSGGSAAEPASPPATATTEQPDDETA